MDLKAIASSLLGAVNNTPNYGGNIIDTPTNSAELGNIRNLGGLYGKGDAAAQATSALGASAGQQADNEEADRRAAAARAEQEASDKQKELERLQDPDEYKQIINKVGGYDFFDPLGNKISAVEYARKKNMQVTDVYKDSQDSNDQDFIDDYKRVTQLGKIIQSGDAKARDKFYKDNPDFKKAYEKSTYNDIVRDLRGEYPGYFRSDDEGDQPAINGQRASDLEDPDKKKGRDLINRLTLGLLGRDK